MHVVRAYVITSVNNNAGGRQTHLYWINSLICWDNQVLPEAKLYLQYIQPPIAKNFWTSSFSKNSTSVQKKIHLNRKWYFVTIIVLTYCEKKIVLVWGKKLRKKFANSRPSGREFVMFSRFFFTCTRRIFSHS